MLSSTLSKVQQQLLVEQLQMMQAERDAAIRHAASLQTSLTAALADASACRRGLANTQLQLQQREAELKKARGEPRFGVNRRGSGDSSGLGMVNRRGSGEGSALGLGSMPQSRRNSLTRRASIHADEPSVPSPPGAELARRASQLGHVGTGSRILTRVLGLVELTSTWRLYDAPSAAVGTSDLQAASAPSAAAAVETQDPGAADLGALLPLLQAVRWQLPTVMECAQCALLLVSPEACTRKSGSR